VAQRKSVFSFQVRFLGDGAVARPLGYPARRAFTTKVEASRALRRAFDKAVRRKPPAFAADAGGYALLNGLEGRCR
jgi:hypothetical protein